MDKIYSLQDYTHKKFLDVNDCICSHHVNTHTHTYIYIYIYTAIVIIGTTHITFYRLYFVNHL